MKIEIKLEPDKETNRNEHLTISSDTHITMTFRGVRNKTILIDCINKYLNNLNEKDIIRGI